WLSALSAGPPQPPAATAGGAASASVSAQATRAKMVWGRRNLTTDWMRRDVTAHVRRVRHPTSARSAVGRRLYMTEACDPIALAESGANLRIRRRSSPA